MSELPYPFRRMADASWRAAAMREWTLAILELKAYDLHMRPIFLLLVAAHVAVACTTVERPVKRVVKMSEIVFRGTITAVSESEIQFRVDRVWKGCVPAVFVMPNVVQLNTCTAGFQDRYVLTGSELLVYAGHWGFSAEGLVAGRTLAIRDADDDLKMLGKGHPPALK